MVASVVAEELLSVTTSSLQSIRNDLEMAERAREREVKDREGVHMDVEERTSRIISRERIEGDCMEGEHFLASSLRQLQQKLPKVPTTVPPSLPIPVELTLSWKALIHQECQSFNSYTFSRSGRDLAASLFLSSPVSSHQVLSTVKPSGFAQAHRAWVDRLPLLQSDKIAESFSTVISSRGDKLKPQVLDEKLTELVLRYSQGASPAVIRALDLSVEGLRSAAFLSPFVSLRSLNLNVNCLLDLHDLKSLSLLEELTVKDNALIDVSSLQYLVNLRRLQLDVNKISDFCSLQNVSKLVSISASSNQISSFPTLPATVERVELYHNNIAIITTKSFVHLRTLMHLDLGRNHLTVLENGVLDSCCLLTTLILSQNKLEELPVLKLPFLRVLWLSGNRVSSFARWTASSDSSLVIFLPMLEKLYLQDNRITCIEPSSLFQSPFLSELDISFNAIVSVENLSGIRAPNLKILSIQDNPVSAFENISAFLQIQCPRLCCLNGSHISLSRISLSTNSLPEANIYVSRDASLKHVVSFLMHEQNFQKFIDRSRTKKEEISEGIGADVALLRSHLLLLQDGRKLFEDRTLCFVPNSNPLLALKNSEKNGDSSVKAATTIEKVFRGHLTRQRLRKALRSVEYQDEDIEAMLRDDALEFEMPSELLAGWMDYTSSTTSFSASVSSCAEADGMAARLPSSRGSPMVYGDHIKRRNPERSMSGPSPLESASSAQYCVGIGDPSRPSSSTTECTLLSVSTEARSELLGVAPPKNSSSAINGWGITDPSLLATLDKRNRRMKRFVAAHETRERQKDPEFRLQQFVKNASGSTRNSNNPKRASERRAVHMPAWAVGYPVQDEEKEEG